MADLDLIERARRGDRRALARAISAVVEGHDSAEAVLSDAFSASRSGLRIGVTGAPGAGKSTLVSALIRTIRADGRSVGVVAVDPSSPFTGGSILGDRVRMQEHADDADVFIRSLSTRGHLGGLAAATAKVAAVIDGVGFDVTLIETVGVGQSEVEIVSEADVTAVVVTPGWGDGVQANKAGILEIADVLIINKADRAGVEETRRDLQTMLELGPETSWQPPILATVATAGEGVVDVWASVGTFLEHLGVDGLAARRSQRIEATLVRAARELLTERLVGGELPGLSDALSDVMAGATDPWAGARRLADGLARQ